MWIRKLTSFLTFFVIAGWAASVAAASDIRTRKHVDDMSPQEWKALEDAIVALHKLDRKDQSGKFIIPQGIDSYERFIQIHGDLAEHGACLHGSEMVWFWHRVFLLHFENALRATNPPQSSNITVPYWDWTERASGSNGFPAAYEDSASPLHHDRLDHSNTASRLSPLSVALNSATEVAQQRMTALLDKPSWRDFGGTIDGADAEKGGLENPMHDVIHGSYIGKDNRNTVRAVADPIFWAHHANLDRLVDQWQKKHPIAPGVVHCFACDAVAYERDPQLGALKVSDVLSNASLKGTQVIYAPRSSAQMATGPSAGPRAASANSGALAADEPAAATSAYGFKVSEQPKGEVSLTIPNIVRNVDIFYRGDVYVFPRGIEFNPTQSFKERYRVGVFGTFGQPSEHAPSSRQAPGTKARVTFDPASIGLEKGKDYEVVIQFVPIDPPKEMALAHPESLAVTHDSPRLSLGADSSPITLESAKKGGDK